MKFRYSVRTRQARSGSKVAIDSWSRVETIEAIARLPRSWPGRLRLLGGTGLIVGRASAHLVNPGATRPVP
jgi:hypothetical protein